MFSRGLAMSSLTIESLDQNVLAEIAQPHEQPHEGWLEKQQGGHTNSSTLGVLRHMASMPKRWQKRYFIHQGSHIGGPALHWYVTTEDVAKGQLAGSMRLVGVTVERLGDCSIVLRTKDRTLNLRAATTAETDAWQACLDTDANRHTRGQLVAPAGVEEQEDENDLATYTEPDSLFAVTAGCLAHSTDSGKSWSPCSSATGLTGQFSKLLVKDTTTM